MFSAAPGLLLRELAEQRRPGAIEWMARGGD